MGCGRWNNSASGAVAWAVKMWELSPLCDIVLNCHIDRKARRHKGWTAQQGTQGGRAGQRRAGCIGGQHDSMTSGQLSLFPFLIIIEQTVSSVLLSVQRHDIAILCTMHKLHKTYRQYQNIICAV